MLGYRQKAVKTIPDDVYDTDVDRISNLPEHLLCHILSFIPTKEAAVTSVLSRRWRYLFTLIPDIDLRFNIYDSSGENIEYKKNAYFRRFFSFISFGYRVILCRNVRSIRKFRLSIQRVHDYCLPGIQALLSTALLSKVQELEIHLEYKYDPTNSLSPAGAGVFMCRTLTSVKLGWPDVDLIVPDSVCLPNLKLLHFDRLRLVDKDTIKRLMQGCPLLEELKLGFTRFTYGFRHIIVEVVDISGSLRKLILDCSRAEYTVVVKSNSLENLKYEGGCFRNSIICINAPNLKSLAFHADPYGVNFIQSPKSLVSAKIKIPWIDDEATCQHVFKLFNTVQSVKSLELTKYSLEALADFGLSLPTFNNLIRLKIDAMPSCYALSKLNESVPRIEELVLHQVAQDDDFFDFECPSSEVLQMCFIKHLKVIQINRFSEDEYEFELVECLLQSGEALKKMIIGGFVKPSGHARIWSFKRCSQECQIVL
ncbi:F-box/LRR-repeat protein At3g59190-like [Coffea eugenioides]|uniref:F-box/LRR-repeat protein At3g59190-like n=1 Tax=Coffea eugenioides TaxID=49369 RepID=UPI000F60482D|nr:F-box/LRR-repeat protein At3g59190-like [Coffea eugenioides]